jgi:acetone carboxylase, gamma subunit
MRIRITEYLEIDLAGEQWHCHRCGASLGDARANYKEGCLVAERPLEEVHPRLTGDAQYGFTPDADYCRLLEFYCPSCGTMIENEYLPPGHPITHELELDLDALQARFAAPPRAAGVEVGAGS